MSLINLASLEGVSGREELASRLQEAYRAAWRTLKLEHDAGLDSLEAIAQLTRLMDEVIGFVFRRVGRDLAAEGLAPDSRLALLALGSYGRRELSPHSDVDLLFMVSDDPTTYVRAFTERALYLMWDVGLDVGYATRTPRDCYALAQTNYDVLTSLLDARFLQGDPEVFAGFGKELGRKVLDRVGPDFVRAKIAGMAERLAKHGGSIYVLEPNVKEGMGGLRDIHTALWVTKVLFGVDGLEALRDYEGGDILHESDYESLSRSREFLLRVRCELHFASNTARDILSMDKQALLAERFAVPGPEGVPAVERFMQEYYRHASRVHQVTDAVLRRALESRRRTPRILMRWKERDLGGGFFSREGALYTREEAVEFFTADPVRMMEAFRRYQGSNMDMSPQLALGIRRGLGLVDDRYREDGRVRDLFFAVLRDDRRLYETLLLMNELGFLGRLVPEFAAIHCKMQHDYYHTYTVDEHSIRAIKELVELPHSHDANLALFGQVYSEVVDRRDVLLLTVLLHDVGKGHGSNHAERGAGMAFAAARRLGLREEDCQTVEFLVRHHLLLSHVAQRRDLHEERTIAEAASAVGSPDRLRLLLLLTMADLKAVGPGVWNEWKGNLITELFLETDRVLQEGGAGPQDLDARITAARGQVLSELSSQFEAGAVGAELAKLTERAFHVYDAHALAHFVAMRLRMEDRVVAESWRPSRKGGYTDLYVVARDHPGLFAKIAGVLSANNVNILGAQILTRTDGIVFDRLQVTDSVMSPITDRVKFRIVNRELEKVLRGDLAVGDLLMTRKLSLPLDRRDRAATLAPTRVQIENDVSDTYTVVDVYATDRIGLLYTITSTLAAMGLSIHTAKVSTKVDQAVDVFYVTDLDGKKVTEEERLKAIRDGLLDALKPGGG